MSGGYWEIDDRAMTLASKGARAQQFLSAVRARGSLRTIENAYVHNELSSVTISFFAIVRKRTHIGGAIKLRKSGNVRSLETHANRDGCET